jgi:ribosomal protein S18 acetylase RimI-like enzyme
MIYYQTTLNGITASMLTGFFVGWRSPHTSQTHYQILHNSDFIVLAIDTTTNHVVGFITCISDGIQSAFIPLLQVLPSYQRQGIGSELVRRLLAQIEHLPAIDLTCAPDLQPFYESLGFTRTVGMCLRQY